MRGPIDPEGRYDINFTQHMMDVFDQMMKVYGQRIHLSVNVPPGAP